MKTRFNGDFKTKIASNIFLTLFLGFFFVGGLISICQYQNKIHGMILTEATVVDIEWHVSSRSSRQDIYITYDINEITYNGEYKTDGMFFSSTAGWRANYSVGDTLEIFYDPNDPKKIAAPRSSYISLAFMIVGLFGCFAVVCYLVSTLKNYRNFVITHEEYEKEKEELKNIRALNKQVGKKFRTMERKKRIYNMLTKRNRY